VASFDNRLMPALRKFQEMGVDSGAEIPEITPVETLPRPLISAPESEEQ